VIDGQIHPKFRNRVSFLAIAVNFRMSPQKPGFLCWATDVWQWMNQAWLATDELILVGNG